MTMKSYYVYRVTSEMSLMGDAIGSAFECAVSSDSIAPPIILYSYILCC